MYAGATKVYDSGVMNPTTATKRSTSRSPVRAQLRLVVTDARRQHDSDHADWALARIECGGGADTTPPTITSRTPAPGATGVALSVSPTATFSEAMNPATITSTTFTLQKQGAPTPGRRERLLQRDHRHPRSRRPTSIASSTYTLTVKGGASGVKDVAGNPLAADVTWTFTTGAGGGGGAPSAFIDSPAVIWKVGDLISFSGHATDPEQGTLPASALTWTLLMQHCPSGCHTHTIQSWDGIASGSFNAPDHEYPSYLELRLVATDSGGLTGSTILRLDPQAVELRFETSPLGLNLSVNGQTSTTPFTRTVIAGSTNSVSATSPQTLSGTTYTFSSWSDGQSQAHNIVAPILNATWIATYSSGPPPTGSTYLSDLTWTSAVDHGGVPNLDVSYSYRPLTLNGTVYPKGIGAHAASDIRYAISGCDRFKASIGVDDFITGTSVGIVVFKVYAGATEIYDSGVMNPTTATKQIDVSIAGASELRLVVDAQGDQDSDHANWAEARIEC